MIADRQTTIKTSLVIFGEGFLFLDTKKAA